MSASVGIRSGLVITTKSGSAGAFLTDGSGRAVVNKADLSTITRSGGAKQVVYDGPPRRRQAAAGTD
jgi:hypothetical protein